MSTTCAVDIGEAYREHGPFIARVLEKLTGRGPHVDDLLQDTFIVAHKKKNQFEGRSTLRTWLYGIAKNRCMHHNRGLARFLNFKERLQRQPEAPGDTPHDALERTSKRQKLESYILAMTFKQREVFVLYELEEMAGQDIAAMLQIPLGTVWTRLHKARKVFQAKVDKETRGGISP